MELHESTSSKPSFFSIAPFGVNGDLKLHSSNGAFSISQYKTSHSFNGHLHQSFFTKAHPSGSDSLCRPFSDKLHSCNGQSSKSKNHNAHGELVGSPYFINLLRVWLLIRRRFFLFCSVLFLLALAFLAFPIVKVYPTLNYPFQVRPTEALSLPLLHFFQGSQANQTLLALAKVDLGERVERAEIKKLLDGIWDRARYPYLRDRHRQGDHYRERLHERKLPWRSRDQRLPIQLSSPRYAPFHVQFGRSLSSWVQNKRYDPHIMKELVTMVKDPIDRHFLNKPDYTASRGKPYKTCAVVGNSGILLNQSHASFIDSHEMVIRLNNARTAGFQQYVGSKTTLSFVNSNIVHSCARRSDCSCHPYGADVPLIMYICQVVHLMDVVMCGSMQHAPILVTDPRFDTLCARIVKYYSLKKFVETTGRRLEDWGDAHEGPMFHYSSGMQAVLLAVGICEKVSIFGFGKSGMAKHHYHTNQMEELHLHDYLAEYNFYTDLAAQDVQLIPFLNETGFSLPKVDIYW